MSEVRREGAAVLGAVSGRRRGRGAAPRTRQVTAKYSNDEYAELLELAAGARLAVAAYVAEASLSPAASASASRPEAAGSVSAEVRESLVELMGVHRQLRGACTNLNQAVRALHGSGEEPAELAAVAAYVRRVTDRVDGVVAALAARADR
jgi:hypothetical protein